jgi:hypothetical protein
MKNIFNIFAVVILCLVSCKATYTDYIVEGRIIDKSTKEPVSDIFVSLGVMHELPETEGKQNIHKTSPIEPYRLSDANGDFRIVVTFCPSVLCINERYYGNENSLYKDTTISIDFSNVLLSGTPHRNYKGDYVLNVGDIELERIDY